MRTERFRNTAEWGKHGTAFKTEHVIPPLNLMTGKKIRFRFTEKSVPWLLLFFTLAAYIPLAAQMGFYWDDWPMLWFKVCKGAEGFAEAFSSDRPFLGNLYRLTASLLSNDPLQWQILTVFFRWTVTLAFWWMIRQLWPDRKRETFMISLLLAVYPGFKQMPIVYVWMNAFIMLLAYVLSYGMMLKAIGSGSKKAWILWTIPSVFLYTFCTISTEYYTGLDICRGVIIWIFLMQQAGFRDLSLKKKALKVFLQWLPYLAVLGVFMFWRVFIFQFPSYQPVLVEEFTAKPLRTLFDTAVRMIEDAYTATWGAWTEFFRFPNHADFATVSGKVFWAAVILALAAVVIVSLLFKSGTESETSDNPGGDPGFSRNWCLTAMGLGAFMVICPGLPYWVTTLPVRLVYPYDRFLVAFMFGSSIFMVGLVEFFLRAEWQRTLLLCLFTAMAVGGDILNANSFRKDWETQRDFAEQLSVRIPSLKQPTLLLGDDNPLTYESDNSLTGLVNLALDPKHEGEDLPYDVMLFTPRFGTIDNYLSNERIYQEFRGSMFGADNDDVVVYHFSPPGCLRIIDPELHSGLNIFPDSYKEFMYLSDPKGRIDPFGSHSDFIQDEIFKQPVRENWCYYFEKADLARQTEDWETIVSIGDQVLSTLKAGEASEYFIFTEAYMQADRWDEAIKLIKRIHAEDKSLDAVLCPYLKTWIGNHKPEQRSVILPLIRAMNNVGCSMDKN